MASSARKEDYLSNVMTKIKFGLQDRSADVEETEVMSKASEECFDLLIRNLWKHQTDCIPLIAMVVKLFSKAHGIDRVQEKKIINPISQKKLEKKLHIFIFSSLSVRKFLRETFDSQSIRRVGMRVPRTHRCVARTIARRTHP